MRTWECDGADHRGIGVERGGVQSMPEHGHEGKHLATPAFCQRLRERNEAAWEDLYVAHENRIRAVAHRVLPVRLDPEALAQQVWVRAIHRARRIDVSRDPLPWLVTMCVNLCISVIRRDQLARRVLRRQRPAEASTVSSFLEIEGHKMPFPRVREGVATLSRDHQQILYLRFACELSNAEIAQAIDVREDTVRKRLSRAYGRLRTFLGDEADLGLEPQPAVAPPMPQPPAAFPPHLASQEDPSS